MPKPQIRPAYRRLPPMLRAMREAAGLTQRDLAQRLKTKQNTIYRMEVGSRRCDAIEFADWCRACEEDPAKRFHELIGDERSR